MNLLCFLLSLYPGNNQLFNQKLINLVINGTINKSMNQSIESKASLVKTIPGNNLTHWTGHRVANILLHSLTIGHLVLKTFTYQYHHHRSIENYYYNNIIMVGVMSTIFINVNANTLFHGLALGNMIFNLVIPILSACWSFRSTLKSYFVVVAGNQSCCLLWLRLD